MSSKLSLQTALSGMFCCLSQVNKTAEQNMPYNSTLIIRNSLEARFQILGPTELCIWECG